MGLRLAFRTLRRAPVYAATAIATMTLSISLAATVFAVVDGVLFKPLPYPSSDRLFDLKGAAASDQTTGDLSPADVRYLHEADERIRVSGFGHVYRLTFVDRPDTSVWRASVDGNFFEVVGQHPLIDGFESSHFLQPPAEGEARPAVVTHRFWRQWLGGSASAVGRTVEMVQDRLIIVGVLPRDFVYPHAFGRLRPDVLVPLTTSSAAIHDRWSRSLGAVGRLRQDIALDEANAKLASALAARVGEYTLRDVRPGPYVAVSMTPLDEYLGATERPLFRLAFLGAALVATLGAINVAGLFAARGRNRERELATRAALGAGRSELARLMLTEALLVALTGSVAGLAALVRRAESFDAALLKSVRLHRFRSTLFAVAAGAGLLLLAVGVAGLVATSVASRVREIGIRSALGARRGRIVRMVVADHLGPALLGTGLGLLLSWWSTRLLSAFLYDIDAHDPAVWAAAALVLMLVAALAAWIPARRASAVDPMIVLRAD